MSLSDKEFLRYNRHIMMNNIGEEGQLTLKNSHVIIVGLGGLGCPAALYLAASGVGKLSLIDNDVVDITNLQRQILFSNDDIGELKVNCAQQVLRRLNPHIEIQPFSKHIEDIDPITTLREVNVILDCTDNIEARHFVNQIAWQAKLKLVTAAAIQTQGQLISFDFSKEDSPCYQCLFPEGGEQVQNCQSAGVLSPLLGMMGSMQAAETIRLLLGNEENLNTLTCFNAWNLTSQNYQLSKSESCKNCL